MLWVALAMEKWVRSDAALAYAAIACSPDLSRGGDSFRWVRALANCVRGRILAGKTGRTEEAVAAFQAGQWAIEAIAVRELVQHALEPATRRDPAALDAAKQRLSQLATRLQSPLSELPAPYRR